MAFTSLERDIPFDGESGHSRLLSKDVPVDSLDNWLRRGFRPKLLVVIFVVHIVSNANEFSTVVAAGKENHSDTKNIRVGDALEIGGVGFEDELVDANGDGPNQ